MVDFFISFFFFSVPGNEGLKNVRLKADPAVQSGDILRLECDYDLENAQLYSIKWYFGDDEFYRFVPKESPPTRVFPLPGVVVDVSIYKFHFTLSILLKNVSHLFCWRLKHFETLSQK